MDIEVKQEKENERFVTEVEGHKAYLSYNVYDDKIDLSYAYTPPELRGKGIAKIVVEYASVSYTHLTLPTILLV